MQEFQTSQKEFNGIGPHRGFLGIFRTFTSVANFQVATEIGKCIATSSENLLGESSTIEADDLFQEPKGRRNNETLPLL
jgi:hypothetical protein